MLLFFLFIFLLDVIATAGRHFLDQLEATGKGIGAVITIIVYFVIVIQLIFLLVVIAFLGSIRSNWKRNWSSRTALQEPKVHPPAFFSPANKINRFYFFPAISKIYY